jgi:tRNA pseudouridine55 synthase
VLHGFLNIDKPAGLTSHDVVARVRRLSGQKKVGHAGTLDPAATGVLPLALGQATRLVEYLADARKGYHATLVLGVTTETDDAEGAVLAEQPIPMPDTAAIEQALARFRGPILQVPPSYSALHHQGQRLYKLAREGRAPALAPRPVRIDELRLLNWQAPYLELDVICGKGTYIRSLARDIGEALGCGAHLRHLRRTFVGAFDLARAQQLDELAPETLAGQVLAPELAVADWPVVYVDIAEATALRHGRPIPRRQADQQARATDSDGRLVALLESDDAATWRPAKVFTWD